jgi:type III restriction enzyme
MPLKIYQTNAIAKISEFFTGYQKQLGVIEQLRAISPESAFTMEGMDQGASQFQLITGNQYFSYLNLGNKFYPNITIKAPTGAGKTLMAIETIIKYNTIIKEGKRTGLVVWLVHRDAIFSQTISRMRDKNDFYRQTLESYFGNNVLIKEKGEAITQDEIENNIVILFVMLQSMARANKENLKIFRDDGRFVTSIFPLDDEYDKHKELLEDMPFLDNFSGADSLQPQVKTSLGNLIRLSKPLILIDEYHKFFTKIGIELLASLNPNMVIGYTATPTDIARSKSNNFEAKNNILVKISGGDLRVEDMIKYPINLDNPPTDYSWKQLVKDLKYKREELEKLAIDNQNQGGSYIRPITLIQVEYTGKDQRGKGVHAEDARDELVSLGIPPHQIAIKSSEIDELDKIDLQSSNCEIRYIITKYALQEGWDCPFAYILGLIPNTNSNTGLTQLIGRILRQPYQSKINKTTPSELDQCYIYYLTGDTQKTVQLIKKGLENDGLEDLDINSNQNGIVTKTVSTQTFEKVKIQPHIKADYSHSLYLPSFWIKSENRKFSFETDIEQHIDWNEFELPQDFYQELQYSFLTERQRSLVKVDWDEQKQEFSRISDKDGNQIITYKSQDKLNLEDLQKSIFEITNLPFFSFRLAQNIHSHLQTNEELQKGFFTNGTLITNEVVKELQNYQDESAKIAFEKLIADDELYLGLGLTKSGAFNFNESIMAKQDDTDRKYLYEKYDWEKLNPFEDNIKKYLFNHDKKLLWWYRNPERDLKDQINFHIQGYRKQKIRPDFVASKIEEATGKLEMVYIIESKGRMLQGNDDTTYKEDMFEILSKQAKAGKIIILDENPLGIDLGINSNIEAHFVYQEQENKTLNKLFNQ